MGNYIYHIIYIYIYTHFKSFALVPFQLTANKGLVRDPLYEICTNPSGDDSKDTYRPMNGVFLLTTGSLHLRFAYVPGSIHSLCWGWETIPPFN